MVCLFSKLNQTKFKYLPYKPKKTNKKIEPICLVKKQTKIEIRYLHNIAEDSESKEHTESTTIKAPLRPYL